MPVLRAVEPACVGCGACCRNWLVGVVPEDFLIHGTPAHLVRDRPYERAAGPEWSMRHKESGACVALDEQTNACTIYANRPQVCRDFERMSRDCWKKIRAEGRIAEYSAPEVRT